MKTFSILLSKHLLLTPSNLYGDFGDVFLSSEFARGHKIYFILKRPLCTFKTAKVTKWNRMLPFKWSKHGHLIAKLSAKREIVKVSIPVSEILYRDEFGITKDEFQRGIFGVDSEAEYDNLKAYFGEPIGFGVKISEDRTKIVTSLYHPRAKTIVAGVDCYKLLVGAKTRLGARSEVIYIGQSTEPYDRLIRHEKIQRALSEKAPDEDILILVAYFKDETIKIENIAPRSYSITGNRDSLIDDNDRLTLIEMFLINYFKPILNGNYADGVKLSGEVLRRSLGSLGYDSVRASFEPDNPVMECGTNSAGYKGEHHFLYKAENGADNESRTCDIN